MRRMWRDFSLSYLKRSRAACISIMASALIASFFITLVSGLFYNMWKDEIRQVIEQEGSWHGQIEGTYTAADAAAIESFANVERASATGGAVFIYFKNPRRTYEDMSLIARKLGVEENSGEVRCNSKLLTQYFIHSPEEKKLAPTLLSIYLCFLALICSSLVMMIHNAFAVTMSARIRQLGILKSVGATPRQIRMVLIQEALAVSLLPILAGIPIGAGVCGYLVQAVNDMSKQLQIDRAGNAVFHFPLGLGLVVFMICLFTVWLSARIPAARLSSMTPLEPVRGPEKITGAGAGPGGFAGAGRRRLVSRLFGLEGELAGLSLHDRRKSFRTARLSLTLSFFVFTAFMNFEIVSYIHTYHTFFQRYKDTWDLMAVLDNGGLPEADLLDEIRQIPGVADCVSYRKYQAYASLLPEELSRELSALGGLEGLKDTGIQAKEDGYVIEVPVLVMDDRSFYAYAQAAGIQDFPEDGTAAVTVNRIWDNVNSRFKERMYVPYVEPGSSHSLELFGNRKDMEQGRGTPLDIAAFAELPPDLREEYADFSLLQVMPETAFRGLEEELSTEEIYYKVLTDSDGEIPAVEAELRELLGGRYQYSLENRVTEEVFNEQVRKGYTIFMGGLCGVLALIGIVNVFANALGTVAQRKREFARYLSVGCTPGNLRKMLALEAFMLCAGPISASLLLNVPFVAYVLHASLIRPAEYIAYMPVIPVLGFAAFIAAAVGTAYWIGGRRILAGNIVDALKDDALL